MINILIFEDDWGLYNTIQNILTRVFEGHKLNIQIYDSWQSFQESIRESISPVHYVFLDHYLASSSRYEYAGDTVKDLLEKSGYKPRKYIGISSDDRREYVDVNIGKFPRPDSLLVNDEKRIQQLRGAICPELFSNEDDELAIDTP